MLRGSQPGLRAPLALICRQAGSVQPLRPAGRHCSSLPGRSDSTVAEAVVDDSQHSRNARPMINSEVTRSNFQEMLPVVKQALNECEFFSFDCEMTGLFPEEYVDEVLDDFGDRYLKTMNSAQQFIVNQFGLSTFAWIGGEYQVKTFNFYIFPRPYEDVDKRFVCQASSLAFLSSHGFDFNKFIYEGISYLPVKWRDERLSELDVEAAKAYVAVTADEKLFASALEAEVKIWLAGAEPALVLDRVSSIHKSAQQKTLLRLQALRQEPDSFVVQHSQDGTSGLVLIRASVQEAQASLASQLQVKQAAIQEATGFSLVLEAMRDCGKPAIAHNLNFDLAFSLHSFAETLPNSWDVYKLLVQKWFPGGLYDTKYIAKDQLNELFSDTTLSTLYSTVADSSRPEIDQFFKAYTPGPGVQWTLPPVRHAPGFESYLQADAKRNSHEAGFDAFMTGVVFCRFLRLMEAKAMGRAVNPSNPPNLRYVEPFIGRYSMGRSDLPFASLWGPDPVPNRPNVFYITRIRRYLWKAEIRKRFMQAGLGRVRVTHVDNGFGAYVEVLAPAQVPKVLAAIRKSQWNVEILPFRDHHARKRTEVSKKLDGAAGRPTRSPPRPIPVQNGAAAPGAKAAGAAYRPGASNPQAAFSSAAGNGAGQSRSTGPGSSVASVTQPSSLKQAHQHETATQPPPPPSVGSRGQRDDMGVSQLESGFTTTEGGTSTPGVEVGASPTFSTSTMVGGSAYSATEVSTIPSVAPVC